MDTEIAVALLAATGTITTAICSYAAAARTHRKSDRKLDAKLDARIMARDEEMEALRVEMRSQRQAIERAFDRMRRTIRRLVFEIEDLDPDNPMIEEAVEAIYEAREILAS